MNKNIKRIIMYAIITGLTATGVISCGKTNEGKKTEQQEAKKQETDQEVIDRLIGETKKYGESEIVEFLEKYRDSFKVISRDEYSQGDKRTKFELNYSDGVVNTTGNFTVIEIATGENFENKEVRIGPGNSPDYNFTNTINLNVTKEDVKKSIANYWEEIDFKFEEKEGNTKVEVNDIYVKSLNDGTSRLTVDFAYNHKDDLVSATGTGTFYITDGERIKVESEKVKNDTYEMFPPSVAEVKELIPDSVVVSIQRGTIPEDMFTMTDKEVDSIEIQSVEQSVGYGDRTGIFDVVATFKKGEEIREITGEVTVIVDNGKYEFLMNHIFVEQM